MKDLLTGEHMLFTQLQNFSAFKSYRILKLGKLVIRISYKKRTPKLNLSDVLRIFELLLHFESNLAEIRNIVSTHNESLKQVTWFSLIQCDAQ